MTQSTKTNIKIGLKLNTYINISSDYIYSEQCLHTHYSNNFVHVENPAIKKLSLLPLVQKLLPPHEVFHQNDPKSPTGHEHALMK